MPPPIRHGVIKLICCVASVATSKVPYGFADLGSSEKVFLGISCATHFAVWEKQRRILQRASLEWLQKTQLNGSATGTFWADREGRIASRP